MSIFLFYQATANFIEPFPPYFGQKIKLEEYNEKEFVVGAVFDVDIYVVGTKYRLYYRSIG